MPASGGSVSDAPVNKIVNGKIVIKLLCQNGNINEYIIDI